MYLIHSSQKGVDVQLAECGTKFRFIDGYPIISLVHLIVLCNIISCVFSSYNEFVFAVGLCIPEAKAHALDLLLPVIPTRANSIFKMMVPDGVPDYNTPALHL